MAERIRIISTIIAVTMIIGFGGGLMVTGTVITFAGTSSTPGGCMDTWSTCYGPLRYRTGVILNSTYNVSGIEIICPKSRSQPCNIVPYNRYYAVYAYTRDNQQKLCQPILGDPPFVNQTVLYIDDSNSCIEYKQRQKDAVIISIALTLFGLAILLSPIVICIFTPK
jgi:hypothetical protein